MEPTVWFLATLRIPAVAKAPFGCTWAFSLVMTMCDFEVEHAFHDRCDCFEHGTIHRAAYETAIQRNPKVRFACQMDGRWAEIRWSNGRNVFLHRGTYILLNCVCNQTFPSLTSITFAAQAPISVSSFPVTRYPVVLDGSGSNEARVHVESTRCVRRVSVIDKQERELVSFAASYISPSSNCNWTSVRLKLARVTPRTRRVAGWIVTDKRFSLKKSARKAILRFIMS